MYRKFLIIAVISLLFVQTADAQSVKRSFGIKGGGVTSIMPKDANATKYYISGYGGIFYGLRFGKTFGIQGEVDFAFQGSHHSFNNIAIKPTQRYIQIPVLLQIWAGRSVIFEIGYQQSILVGSSLIEDDESISFPELSRSPFFHDPGAHKYYGSIIGGVTFNLGKVIFLNLRYTYGISNSYSIYNKAYTVSTAQVGIGFRLYNSKRTIYK